MTHWKPQMSPEPLSQRCRLNRQAIQEDAQNVRSAYFMPPPSVSASDSSIAAPTRRKDTVIAPSEVNHFAETALRAHAIFGVLTDERVSEIVEGLRSYVSTRRSSSPCSPYRKQHLKAQRHPHAVSPVRHQRGAVFLRSTPRHLLAEYDDEQGHHESAYEGLRRGQRTHDPRLTRFIAVTQCGESDHAVVNAFGEVR